MEDISKLINDVPEIDLSKVSEDGKIFPFEIAMIKYTTSISEGKDWDLVYVGGKITFPESLKQFKNPTLPCIIYSNNVSDDGRIDIFEVLNSTNLQFLRGYKSIMKL